MKLSQFAVPLKESQMLMNKIFQNREKNFPRSTLFSTQEDDPWNLTGHLNKNDCEVKVFILEYKSISCVSEY